MGMITDGAVCPPGWSPVNPLVALLKHAVQVAHPRAPIGSWPPADPSLAVTPTDATGRQDCLSPRMGQLILLWPSWHLLGATLHCLTTLTVLCLQVLAGACGLAAVIVQRCRSQEAPFSTPPSSCVLDMPDPAVPATGLDYLVTAMHVRLFS